MGIYFDESTYEEDASFIKTGINNGSITKDFMWANYDEESLEKDVVWKPCEDGKVNINGVFGTLTITGRMYIMTCLVEQKRFSSTL
jgi:hypothetical protein